MRDIVVALFKISGHPKITNLQKQKQKTNKQTNKTKQHQQKQFDIGGFRNKTYYEPVLF